MASLESQRILNEKREKYKAEMSPSQLARLMVIEECSAKLEAAGVPFALFAASNDPRPEDGYCDWWQFNKMDYSGEDKSFTERTHRSADGVVSLTPMVLSYVTRVLRGSFVYYDSQQRPRSMFSDGQETQIPSPPEIPPDVTT